jgi:hypothetical protein
MLEVKCNSNEPFPGAPKTIEFNKRLLRMVKIRCHHNDGKIPMRFFRAVVRHLLFMETKTSIRGVYEDYIMIAALTTLLSSKLIVEEDGVVMMSGYGLHCCEQWFGLEEWEKELPIIEKAESRMQSGEKVNA